MTTQAPQQAEALLLDIRAELSRSRRLENAAHEDLTQDTAVRVLTRIRDAAPPDLSRAYVRRIAKNAAIDAARSTARRTSLLAQHRAVLESRSGSDDPERRTSSRHLRSVLHERIDRLPKGRRDAVSLFLAGYGVTEIAQRTGHNRKRVDNLVYRGLAALREDLRSRGITPTTCLLP